MEISEGRLRELVIEAIGELNREVDTAAVRELTVWFENNETIWKRRVEPLINTLVKKITKNENVTVERLANSSIMDKIVRETVQEYWKTFDKFLITTPTRKALRESFASLVMEYVQDQL